MSQTVGESGLQAKQMQDKINLKNQQVISGYLELVIVVYKHSLYSWDEMHCNMFVCHLQVLLLCVSSRSPPATIMMGPIPT